MIVDVGAQSLAELNAILSKIRKFSGANGSETSYYGQKNTLKSRNVR